MPRGSGDGTKPKWLFAIDARWDWWLILVVIATFPWLHAENLEQHRNEMNLERHQQLLLKRAWTRSPGKSTRTSCSITLNTVTALIRFDPDSARA